MTLEFYPLANVLPLLEGAEFDRLCEDIAENGLGNPVMLYQGKILDGRNRSRAHGKLEMGPTCGSGREIN